MHNNNFSGTTAARKLIDEFPSRDVYAIAANYNVSIRYGKWFPVTIGEFERVTNTITVNEHELIKMHSKEQIIAHELGHYFAKNMRLSRLVEECFADDFAAELLGEGNK